jgi:hypothetical protein
VNDERANLLSCATTLDDITERVTATADRVSESGNDAMASDLYEVERALRNANRRLARVVASLRD